MTEPTDELKPCPFCGGKPVVDATFWGLQPQVRCGCGAPDVARGQDGQLPSWPVRTGGMTRRVPDDWGALRGEFWPPANPRDLINSPYRRQAIATEAGTAETLGSVHEHATAEGGDAQNPPSGNHQ